MKHSEPESMREIHIIRERMQEEMKGMTAEEFVNKINADASKCKEMYGIKLPQKITIEK